MKKILVLAVTAVCAAVVGGLMAGPAKAAPLCEAPSYSTGYFHNSIPGIGNAIFANLKSNGGNIYLGSPSGQIYGYVGVDDGTANGQFIQAGIMQKYGQSAGVQFIGWRGADGVIHQKFYNTATNGSAYTARVTHTANGSWTAQIGSNPLTESISLQGTQAESQFAGVSQDDQSGRCNTMSFAWSGLSPWSVPLLTQDYNGVTCPFDNYQFLCRPNGYPYLLATGGLGNNGFTVSGG